jgi:hypothetical protein
MDNTGIPAHSLGWFVEAYIEAVEMHIGEQGQVITEPLRQYTGG